MRKLFVILLIFCFSCKQNESNLILEYEKMAKNDIEKDSVKLFSHGLPLPPRDKKEQYSIEKQDSIKKIFGLYKSSTCIVSDELTQAEKKYEEITQEYLEKRNGKNWEQKMQKQIDSIINQ